MDKTFWTRFFVSHCDNRKSKTCTEPFDSAQDKLRRSIQNLKLGGIVAIGVTFAMSGAVALAQQPTKVTPIGYLGGASLSAISARIEAFRHGLRELNTWRGKTLAFSGYLPTENPIASQRLRPS